MIPVGLGPACFVVEADVIDVSVHGREKRSTESTSPGTLPPRVLDDLIGMRAGFTIMSCLVVLVEGVGPPKHAIAVRTWILLVPFMKFVFVSFPVKLPLELGIAATIKVSKGVC